MKLDLVLVGAGLANGLLAHRLSERRPELKVLVLEAGRSPGGNHTWSFHDSDVPAASLGWLQPFVENRWNGYDVIFPGFRRSLDIGYLSVTSERFAAVLARSLGDRLRCGTDVVELKPTSVRLASGEVIEAGAVVDGRGPVPTVALRYGFQLFLGQELRLAAPHGLSRPVLMDATVPQHGAYRFVYVLPFGPDRLLVEDTYYAGSPDLDAEVLRGRVGDYVRGRGWTVAEILREETGVLPVTLDGDLDRFWREGVPGLPRTGLRAALHHPTTGYSLPDAVRLAEEIAQLPDLSAAALRGAVEHWSRRRWRQQSFYRFLNRMLFEAGKPEHRFRVFRLFYRLPEATIRRFYAGEINALDKLRLVTGKPPVPILEALRTIAPRASLPGHGA